MPLDIGKAENAFLVGHAKFMTWLQEFEAQWYRPIGKTVLQELWNSMTEEQLDMLREMNPEAFDKISEQIGGG